MSKCIVEELDNQPCKKNKNLVCNPVEHEQKVDGCTEESDTIDDGTQEMTVGNLKSNRFIVGKYCCPKPYARAECMLMQALTKKCPGRAACVIQAVCRKKSLATRCRLEKKVILSV